MFRSLACSEIAAIVFPRITGEPGTFALRRLTEAEVVEEIPDMLFGVRGGRFTSSVFADRPIRRRPISARSPSAVAISRRDCPAWSAAWASRPSTQPARPTT